MRDKIFESFLARQLEEGMALAAASDLIELEPGGGPLPDRFLVSFHCKGLVRFDGVIGETDFFQVGIWFPSDYLRRAEPFQVLTWIGPRQVFHPNISDRAPFICVGRLAPATPLLDLIYQCFEIITYNKVTMREDDALNKDACAWARQNLGSFPVDRRPLKRRPLELQVEAV
jgi:hypothetical protein